jgi:type II secretory pathway pseudopilin PulG
MLVVVTLLGLISTGVSASVMQLLTINTRSSNHMIAVRQVQQVGKEVRKDALQAQNVTLADTDSGFPLTLQWNNWEGQENEVVYAITEDNKLQRSHNIDGSRIIAQYIDPDQTSCCCDCNGDHVCEDDCDSGVKLLVFTITATVSGGPQQATETRVYEIEPRSD